MKTRRVTVSAGTPREIAGHAIGYSVSGESQHTRHVARGHEPMVRTNNAVAARRISKGHQLPLPLLITETRGALRWLKCELEIETNPTRHAKLTKNLEIKTRYLAELEREAEQRP
jgi:hypothetical protein